jgi:O-methyltransferase domain
MPSSQPLGAGRARVSFEAIGTLADLADLTLPFTLRAVCHLGVADHLGETPRSYEELAKATGTHPPSLLRAMRALTTKGIFAEPEPGYFTLTPVSGLLRTDHPMSMRWAYRLRPDVEAWSAMDHSVRTGDVAFDHVYGEDYWSYLSHHPDLYTQFRESQRALTRIELQALLRVYDWSSFTTLTDLGGNDGAFLCGLLSRFPRLSGTLMDFPGAIASAAGAVAAAGFADRVSLVSGDLLEAPIPPGADAYTCKRVLIGFSDAEIEAFLRAVLAAMRPDSKLLILEPSNTSDEMTTAMDLHMLVLGKGRVRQPAEFAALIGASGLHCRQVVDARLLNLFEVVPAAAA